MSGIRERIAAAEPAGSRPLQDLLERLAERGLLTAEETGTAHGSAGLVEIHGITQDSRTVRPGTLFVAVPGLHVDGRAFVDQAVRAGAAAVLVERGVGASIPQVVVRDARRALATAAAWWSGDPARHLDIVGITGTDGKTTSSILTTAALEAAG
ncbi:MAG: Mur ligase domain-containing protein, partial [Chloroflexota bacterium]